MDDLFVKKIYCRHRLKSGEFCNTVVATSNGSQLFFNGEPVKNDLRFIGFDCPKCHQLVKWRRANKQIKARS